MAYIIWLIIGLALFVYGTTGIHRVEQRNNDGDMGDALMYALSTIVAILIFAVVVLAYAAQHLHAR